MNQQQQQQSYTPLTHSQMVLLAPDFCPGPYDVICSRGGAAKRHPGNQRYRATIEQHLHQYSLAQTKSDKTAIVNAVIQSVRGPNGGFCKKLDDGFWYEVGDAMAREKTGQIFRDRLHTQYKSSTKAKKSRRKEIQHLHNHKRKQQQPPTMSQPAAKKCCRRRCSNKEPIDLSLPNLLRLISTGPKLWFSNNNDHDETKDHQHVVTRAQQALLRRQRTDYLSKINITIPDVPTSWKAREEQPPLEPLPANQRQSTMDHASLTHLLQLISSGPNLNSEHVVKSFNSTTGKLDLIDEHGDNDVEIDLDTLLHMMPVDCQLCQVHRSAKEQTCFCL